MLPCCLPPPSCSSPPADCTSVLNSNLRELCAFCHPRPDRGDAETFYCVAAHTMPFPCTRYAFSHLHTFESAYPPTFWNPSLTLNNLRTPFWRLLLSLHTRACAFPQSPGSESCLIQTARVHRTALNCSVALSPFLDCDRRHRVWRLWHFYHRWIF